MKTDLGTLVCEIAEGLERVAEEQRSRSVESMVSSQAFEGLRAEELVVFCVALEKQNWHHR